MLANHAVHVDTDLGGDPDDACALAMLLGWPGIEVVGVTTNLDVDGGRAGCAEYLLQLAGRGEVPVVAGAADAMTDGRRFASTAGDARYWPATVQPVPAPRDAASALLARSIDAGATVIAIGALTNLARLERDRPGALAGVDVVVMGGWFAPPARGYPQWGPEMDFNVQCDPAAAAIVLAAADVTLVPLPVAMRAQLVASVLGRLRSAGPVGALLAMQSEAHRDDSGFRDLAHAHPALPSDLVNFHWDPLTAAVAVGWDGADVEVRTTRAVMADGMLRFEDHPRGRATRVVVDIDVDGFAERWLSSVEAL